MPESATVAVPVGRGASDPRRVASQLSASGSAGVEKGWPLRLGVLTAPIGPALVDEVVAAPGRARGGWGGGGRGRGGPAGGAAAAGPRGGLLRARVVPVQRRGRGRPRRATDRW